MQGAIGETMTKEYSDNDPTECLLMYGQFKKMCERAQISKFRAMCEESLPPLLFAEFEKIEAELKRNRGIQETP